MIRRIVLMLPVLLLATCLTLLPACGKKAAAPVAGGGGNGDPAAPGGNPGEGNTSKSSHVLFAHLNGNDVTSSVIFTEIQKAFQTPDGKKMWDGAMANAQEELGVKPTDLASASFYVTEVSEQMDAKYIGIVTTLTPLNKDAMFKFFGIDKGALPDSRGFFKGRAPGLVYMVDDKTMAFVHPDLADKFATGFAKDRNGWPVSAELTKAAAGHALYVNGDLTLIPAALRNGPATQQMQELTSAKSALLTLDFKGKQIDLNARLGFADAAAAGKAKEKAQPFLGMAGFLVGNLTTGKGAEDLGPILPAVKELQNMASGMKMDVSGSDLTVAATYKADFDIPALVTQALAEVKKSATKLKDSNNFKQAMLALHAYHDVNNVLAIHGIGAKGVPLKAPADKALLSWRVAILPYIEQEALYKQFKLDEPWDSENNKKLIDKMPSVFAPPAGKTAKPGYTHMQMIIGPNAMTLNGMKIPASFPDGLSNTIALVEAAEAVVWTKPDDVMLTGKETGAEVKKKLGGLRPGGILVALWDGSVRMVSDKISDKTLLDAINPREGNVLGSDW